jgi:deoxyribonuclease V
MIVAIDVHYRTDIAKIVAIEFQNWTDAAPDKIVIAYKTDIDDYEPGASYKRELPCIVEIMQQIDLNTVDFLIVDGYVFLDSAGKKGLGYYVFEHFNKKIPIIGVAKSHFFDNDKFVLPILRGESKNPLYITAIGMELYEAADCIEKMDGSFRMPTLLKQLDTLTKEV